MKQPFNLAKLQALFLNTKGRVVKEWYTDPWKGLTPEEAYLKGLEDGRKEVAQEQWDLKVSEKWEETTSYSH